MADMFQVMHATHEKVEQMLDRMDAMIGASGQPSAELMQDGGALADTLISTVSQHEAAEEQYFWPAVKDNAADGESLVQGGIEQESEAKKVLTKLDGMNVQDEQFAPLMSEFSRAARAHVAYEEQQVWPALRAALSSQEADDLGDKIDAATRSGPTRPHAHTPPNPAVLKAAGPAVAAADKLRDAVSGREN